MPTVLKQGSLVRVRASATSRSRLLLNRQTARCGSRQRTGCSGTTALCSRSMVGRRGSRTPSVYSLWIDHGGTVWAGTHDGLFDFDGHRFQEVKLQGHALRIGMNSMLASSVSGELIAETPTGLVSVERSADSTAWAASALRSEASGISQTRRRYRWSRRRQSRPGSGSAACPGCASTAAPGCADTDRRRA